jgi:DinB superfamily
MKYNSSVLIESLQSEVRIAITKATHLKNLSTKLLIQQPNEISWSITQVIEHLNLYCVYYNSAIEKQLHFHTTEPVKEFKTGWLGNYFTNLMKPKTNNTIGKKMNAIKNAMPKANLNAIEILTVFIGYQHQLLNLMEIAKSANISSIRVQTSLSKFITLKLGDIFNFLIAHQQRHFLQIENIKKAIGVN